MALKGLLWRSALKVATLLVPMLLLSSFSSVFALETTPTPEPTSTPTPEPTPLPTEMVSHLAQSSSPETSSGCLGDRCTFIVEAGTDDAGDVAPFPVVGPCCYSTAANEVYFGECPNGDTMLSGFRFPNVSIPAEFQDFPIFDVYLEFTVDGPYTNNVEVDIFGEAFADPLPFGNFPFMPAQRTRTTENVRWSIPASDEWQLNQIRRTPNLLPVFEEITGGSWQDGNAMAFIFDSALTGNGQHRRVLGFERPGTTSLQHARLVILFAANPEASVSHYWKVLDVGGTGIDPYTMRIMACEQANREPDQSLVILSFGSPIRVSVSENTYGANPASSGIELTVDEIEAGVQHYLDAYWWCSQDTPEKQLTLAIGITSDGLAFKESNLNISHATEWGLMTTRLDDWIDDGVCLFPQFTDGACNYHQRVRLIAGLDIEAWELQNLGGQQTNPQGILQWV